jgi:hypothetical protein
MIELLEFLIRYCPQLLEKPGFKFKDSETGPHASYGSWILLESSDVQIMVSNERNDLLWKIRSLHDPDEWNWFSFDLFAGTIGCEVMTALMTSENSELLKNNLDTIIALFAKEKLNATLAQLNVLRVERADRPFGRSHSEKTGEVVDFPKKTPR